MRIFITGANGQLGMALQRQLTSHELAVTDLPDMDITDTQAIIEATVNFAPDVVLHCAAYTDVDGCALNPSLAYRVNGLGTQNVALACQRSGAEMVHISTNEVFAGDRPDGYDEWMPVDPINPYACSKAAAEFHVRGLLSKFYIVRTAWLYADGGKNFIHSILRSAEKSKALRVVADEIANPTYAGDLAAAIVSLIPSKKYGIYHLVNEGFCSRLDFAKEALRLTGMDDVAVTPILSSEYVRVSRPPLFSGLNNIAGAAIGVQLRPWQKALAAYLNEYGKG